MDYTREETTYEHDFRYADDHGAGFSFPCDKDGNINSKDMNKAALNNYRLCLLGVHKDRKVEYMGIKTHTFITHLCMCGSGKDRYPLYDARGIFCCFVCEDCEKIKRNGYRSDIFTDANYEITEDIDE